MRKIISGILLCTAFSACSASSQHSHSGDHTHTAKSISIAALEGGLINPKALVEPPVNTSCTLEDGSNSECLKVVIKYLPDDQPIGPFCPKTIDDVGGIWNWDGDNPGLYRVDRDFFEMLDAQGFTFYEQDGSIHIADISVAGPAHDHACINVSEDEDVQITLLIPLTPRLADASTRLGIVSKVGLALDGAPIFSDAPSVQHTGHMPALDTCGGHVDPGGWYHFHATASDLEGVYKRENVEAKCALTQNPSALFGFAFDGFPIYGAVEQDGSKPAGLDSCGGHSFDASSREAKLYHYHASESFPNLPKCLSGVSARNNFATTAQAGIGAIQRSGQSTRREPPGGQAGPRGPRGQAGMPPGFEDAAAKLDVTAEQLLNAMNAAGGPNADLSAVAKTLEIDVASLQSALPQRPTNR